MAHCLVKTKQEPLNIYIMKKLLITLSVAIYSSFSFANAPLSVRNYSNAFIFNERGIEFAVFPDGQFDFNVLNRRGGVFGGNQIDVNVGFNGQGYVSFNAGYQYDHFIQYDDFGAIIQIQNVPVFYDYYGRVRQIGNVRIHYNHNGYVRQIGRLYIGYRPNLSFYYHGYINSRNRFYTQRPWHVYYRRPSVQTCVVYDLPYRRYYTPNRRHYTGPYRNNRRPAVYHGNTRSRRTTQTAYTNSANRNRNSSVRTTTTRSVSRVHPANSGAVRTTTRTRTTTQPSTPNRVQQRSNKHIKPRGNSVVQQKTRTVKRSAPQSNRQQQKKRSPSRLKRTQ